MASPTIRLLSIQIVPSSISIVAKVASQLQNNKIGWLRPIRAKLPSTKTLVIVVQRPLSLPTVEDLQKTPERSVQTWQRITIRVCLQWARARASSRYSHSRDTSRKFTTRTTTKFAIWHSSQTAVFLSPLTSPTCSSCGRWRTWTTVRCSCKYLSPTRPHVRSVVYTRHLS